MVGVEECDDGDTDPDDGCSPTCEVEAGWECSNGPELDLAPDEFYAESSTDPGWVISADALTATQTTNSDPAFLVTSLPATATTYTFDIAVETSSDDDFIGFAVGMEAGETADAAADYLLVDWKHGTQNYFSQTAQEGLAVSRVQGLPG